MHADLAKTARFAFPKILSVGVMLVSAKVQSQRAVPGEEGGGGRRREAATKPLEDHPAEAHN